MRYAILAILVIVSAASTVLTAGQSPVSAAHRLLQLLRSQPPPVLAVPRTWDEEAMASVELPLASTGAPPEHISSDYFARLKQLEPEIAFDPAELTTEADWIKAGELVFDAPGGYESDLTVDVRNPAWYAKVRPPLTKDGVMPYRRYVIRKKGIVEVGSFSCAMCHTRVMADGSVVKGAQGNFPADRGFAFLMRTGPQPAQERLELQRNFIQLLLRPLPYLSRTASPPVSLQFLPAMTTAPDGGGAVEVSRTPALGLGAQLNF